MAPCSRGADVLKIPDPQIARGISPICWDGHSAKSRSISVATGALIRRSDAPPLGPAGIAIQSKRRPTQKKNARRSDSGLIGLGAVGRNNRPSSMDPVIAPTKPPFPRPADFRPAVRKGRQNVSSRKIDGPASGWESIQRPSGTRRTSRRDGGHPAGAIRPLTIEL